MLIREIREVATASRNQGDTKTDANIIATRKRLRHAMGHFFITHLRVWLKV